jgi:carbamoyltransferase
MRARCGGALGAAWAVLSDGRPTPTKLALNHLYLGSDIGAADDVCRELEAWGDFLGFVRSPDVAADAAKLLADGNVIGWVQGRSEFGPRALGNRSILADPRPAENKTLINAMVKKREQYRPFAPSVIEERAREYFELPSDRTFFPFMVVVLRVREPMRSVLGAVTHVDGTARVQTVSKVTNPLFWRLIDRFGALTGVSVLLNTSFNNNAEPIVNSVEDAVVCLLTTGLTYLVVGPYIVTKKDPIPPSAVLGLAPEVPLWRKLVRRRQRIDGAERPVLEIGSTRSAFFGAVATPVSTDIFALLERADGTTSASRLLDRMDVNAGTTRDRFATELFDLWAARVITLRPPPLRTETTL